MMEQKKIVIFGGGTGTIQGRMKRGVDEWSTPVFGPEVFILRLFGLCS